MLQRSVFDRLPGERRWGTVLLLDGNIGIGGDPVRLLRRCADLVRPRGQVLAEVGRDLATDRAPVLRMDTARRRPGLAPPPVRRPGDVVLLAA